LCASDFRYDENQIEDTSERRDAHREREEREETSGKTGDVFTRCSLCSLELKLALVLGSELWDTDILWSLYFKLVGEMHTGDLYKLLNVSRGASLNEIKNSYRRLLLIVFEEHPEPVS
jgi:DnaJ-domain-containing protein 1